MNENSFHFFFISSYRHWYKDAAAAVQKQRQMPSLPEITSAGDPVMTMIEFLITESPKSVDELLWDFQWS
jgi:hypothetical protein